jgi:hypothetical protein
MKNPGTSDMQGFIDNLADRLPCSKVPWLHFINIKEGRRSVHCAEATSFN